MESQAVALHVPGVRERMPSSLLNRRSTIAQLAAVMDAERCDAGSRRHDPLRSDLSGSNEERPSHSRCPAAPSAPASSGGTSVSLASAIRPQRAATG